MKFKVLLLFHLLILSACNNVSFENKSNVPNTPIAPTPPVTLTGSYLQTWNESLPDDFKNLTSGQINHQIGMNSSGDAVIAWEVHGSTKSFYLSHLKNSVWTHPTLGEPFNLSLDAYAYTNIRKVIVSDSGEVKILYAEGNHIYLYEYKNGAWVSPNIIGTSTTSFSSSKVATTSNGKILIVSVFGDKIASVYFNGTSWVDHGELKFQNTQSVSLANIKYLSLALDNSGNGLLSFSHTKSNSSFAIYRAEFNGTNWTMPSDENSQISPGLVNRVAMNAAGKSVFMWQTYDDIVHFQENNGSGWEAEYTFNPGFWITVEKMETFVSSAGEVLAVWPDSNLLKFYKKSGTAAIISHSLPINVSQFLIKQTSGSGLAMTWNASNEVSYLRCDFSSCDTASTVSPLERDAQNNPISKVVKNFDASEDRISIFWEQNSYDINGVYVRETAGAEESSLWPIYLLPPIQF